MMTVNEVSRLTGVSIRTLQYYDQIGLLHPAGRTKAGYRLYDDAALERLQQILLFRELEFPLREIQRILESPSFDRIKALDQQITLLTLKKQHLESLICLAKKIQSTGGNVMDFTAFDTQKIEKYTEQAKKVGYNAGIQRVRGKDRPQNNERGIRSWKSADEHRCSFRWIAKQRPGGLYRAGTGEKTAGVYHGALLHLLQDDFESAWPDVRRGR